MKCWKCNAELPEPTWGKLPFRSTCDFCASSLHCCKNCHFYKPGLPNDCIVPGTNFISDRTATNFCEDFKLLGKGPEKKFDPNEIEKKLFGEGKNKSIDNDPKNVFKQLFKDDE